MKVDFSKTCGIKKKKSLFTAMCEGAKLALEKEGLTPDEIERAELSVTFLKDDKIKALNKEYRNKDKVTDVLSFPMYDDINDFPEEGEIPLGDVVINKEQAEAQAEEYGHTVERELIYLFVHSVLHLLGYDHENKDDKKVMRKREEEIMEELGLER